MDARQALLQQLQSLRGAGVTHLPAVKRSAVRAAVPPSAESAGGSPEPVVEEPPASVQPQPAEETPLPKRSKPKPAGGNSIADRTAALEVLAAEVAGCTRCGELARTRKQTVFGVGNPRPRLVFYGEAPGADEDRQGEPFVGRAGQLLDKILEACGLRRDEVYILNTLKCRPPANRTPLPEEVANCSEYFERQIAILQPEFICCLGAVAAKSLFENMRSLGQMRGKVHSWREYQVVVTYHPAYLLRNPDMKRAAWEDMQMLLTAMGLPIPNKS